MITDKIITYDQVRELSRQLKNFEQFTILFRSGCYDIVHIGHVLTLERDKQIADIVVVGIGTDANIAANKSTTIFDQYNRAYLIAALSCVDYVVILEEPSVNNIDHRILLTMLQPDYYYIPADDKFAEYKQELADEIGCKLVVTPLAALSNFGQQMEPHSSLIKANI